jgi:Flp pilus assembly protein TadD
MIEARHGEIEVAVEKLVDARAADPENELESTAVKEIAIAYGKEGDYAKAADFYAQITKQHPDDFPAWLALGTARHRAEQMAAAREAYLRATQLRPNSPLPWHNLGLLASDQGHHEEARAYFQREVELAPNDAKAWYDLGVSLRTLGMEDESAEAFERADELVKTLARRSSDLSAALSIVRRCYKAISAARTVLLSSIAMVIGPTPPGFGVMAPATWRTASKSTSPTRR